MFTTRTRPLARGPEELRHRFLKADMLLNYQPDPFAKRDAEILRLSRNGKSAVKIVTHLRKDFPEITLRVVYRLLHDNQTD